MVPRKKQYLLHFSHIHREIEHVPEKEKQEMVDMYATADLYRFHCEHCLTHLSFLDTKEREFLRKMLAKLSIYFGLTKVPAY